MSDDGKYIYNATHSEIGEKLRDLAIDTVKKVARIVADSSEIKTRSHSLTGYMLNENMTFLQLIEFMIAVHKEATANSYSLTAQKMDEEQ